MTRWLTAVVLLLGLSPARGAEIDYEKQVKPLLAEKCGSCHGPVRQEAGMRLDAASLVKRGSENGPVIVSGHPEKSLLIERVSDSSDERMPPPGEGEALTPEQLDVLSRWITEGLPAPEDETILADPSEHWAYLPIRAPELPTMEDAGTQNPIDALVSAGQQRLQLKPAPPADRETLLRRVYLDLIGLPPTPEELRNFLADTSPIAYEEVVDRLLQSPRYGERWGRHWMDVWRYSDWDGFGNQVRGSQRHIWHWRDWIIESLNADKGYDQMVREMLAGDELSPTDPDMLRATGYLVRSYHTSNRDIWLDATVEHSAKAFLGMTINCARCHDHKYDPLDQREYYAFRAVFEPHQVRTDHIDGQPNLEKDGLPRAYDADLDAVTYLYRGGNEKQPDKDHPLDPSVPKLLNLPWEIEPIQLPLEAYFPLLNDEQERKEIGAAEKKLQEAREELAKLPAVEAPTVEDAPSSTPPSLLPPQPWPYERQHAELNLQASEARLASLRATWAADNARYRPTNQTASIPELSAEAARAQRLSKHLSAQLEVLEKWKATQVAQDSTEKDEAKRKQALQRANNQLTAARKQLQEAIAGLKETDDKYESVGPVYPQTSSGRRLALARWITHPDNPLTPRVAVNHIWMRHFGQPLVDNVFDFGLRSPRPEQQELLDWLASELIARRWSMKALHRVIVTSQVYRQSSSPDAELAAHNLRIDPENRYLWKANVQRLEAEVIRDSLLSLSGLLDSTYGGPDVPFSQGETDYRRSVYFQHAYEKQMPMLVLFDAASPIECYRRSPSVIPQQALALVNSSLSLSAARALHKNLNEELGESPVDDEVFTRAAFERILSRQPISDELQLCLTFLREQTERLSHPEQLEKIESPVEVAVPPAEDPANRARENLVHVLLNHNDFVSSR